MTEKVLIFDASSLITLAMNGLLEEFKELKKIFNGKFIITEEVKKETINRPLKIKRFALDALKIKQLLDDKFLEMPSSLNINSGEISEKTLEFMKRVNSIFQEDGRNIKIIHSGEASCMVLSKILNEKRIENVIVVDERTTKMLGEKPENLEKLLQRKLHKNIIFKKENFKLFEDFKFIRSSELVYVMYKKGITKLKNHAVLDALLYAVKFKGCAISGDEIREIERLG